MSISKTKSQMPHIHLTKNQTFVIVTSFAAAITISLLFYWVQTLFLHKHFLAMLKKTIPQYQNLIYSKGHVQRINADQLLTFNDLESEDFCKEKGKITLAWDNIAQRNNIPQQMGSIKHINFDNMIQMEALDKEVFTIENGKISVNFPKLIREFNLVQEASKSRIIDLGHMVTSEYIKELYIDLKTGRVNHFSHLGLLTNDPFFNGIMLKEQVIIVGDNWEKAFPSLKKMTHGRILPLTPWKIRIMSPLAKDVPLFFKSSIIVENIEALSINDISYS